jgi:hypothetical protein
MRHKDGAVLARKDDEPVPGDESAALARIAKNSLKMTELGTSERMRAALTALSLKLDGTAAADNTLRRKRTVLNNALRYAVERDLFTVNPLSRLGLDRRRATVREAGARTAGADGHPDGADPAGTRTDAARAHKGARIGS